MRTHAALLLMLVAALVIHPLTHVSDDGLCPCVHGAAVAVAGPVLTVPLGDGTGSFGAISGPAGIRCAVVLPSRAPPAV